MKTKAKGLKKAFAIIMALAVVLSYSMVPTFADGAATPTTTLSVSGVETGATLTAYKLVSMDDNNKYNKATGVNIKDITKPEADEILAIANDTTLLGKLDTITGFKQADGAKDGDPYTKTVDATKDNAGLYLVMVTKPGNGDKKYVYQPMLIAVNYEDNGTFTAGSVDASGDFKKDGGKGDAVYAKRSEPDITKKIKSEKHTSTNEKGNTMGLKVGDTVEFVITADVPAYTKAYDNDNLVYEIKDTLSEGLTAPADPATAVTVKDASKTLVLGENGDYTIVKDGNGFKISLTRKYLIKNNDTKLTIEYSAKLNDKAKSGFTGNTNDVELTYSNDPTGNTGSKKDGTKHYTFDINGEVGGKYKDIIREIVKTGIDETTGETLTAEKTLKDEETEYAGLNGAVFGLYTDAECKNELYESTTGDTSDPAQATATDKKGYMQFTKLKAGTYYIKEKSAPAPYAKSDKVVKVVISADIDETSGNLKSYSVRFYDNATGAEIAGVKYENKGETIERVNVAENQASDATMFNNYKAGELPSTGGMGTVLFTIAGIALMAIAAGLLLASRRRNAEEE